MAKNSFILYHDQKEVIDELDDEQAGKLFKAIYEYNTTGKMELTGALKIIFIPFKTAFDRNDEKWDEIAERRSEAGKKHKGNQYTRKKENGTNGTSVPKMEQNGTNGTVSVSVSDSVSVNVSDSVSVSVNNIPDTHTTVLDFASSIFEKHDKKQLERSCKKFFNFYNAKKWVGISNWQEQLILWLEDDIADGKIKVNDDAEYVDEAGFVHRNGRRVF